MYYRLPFTSNYPVPVCSSVFACVAHLDKQNKTSFYTLLGRRSFSPRPADLQAERLEMEGWHEKKREINIMNAENASFGKTHLMTDVSTAIMRHVVVPDE